MKKFNHLIIRYLVILVFISLSACQAPVEKTPGWSSDSGEVRPGPDTGKAVLALLKKAQQASNTGDLSTAESQLERALRIEPQNPALWLYMAKLRLFAAKSKEAINLAKKALALSSRANLDQSRRESLQADSWLVIAHAYQKMGNFTEAHKAQEKAKSLSD